MVAQKATREIGDVGTATFSLFDSVELVFGVKVASNARLGPVFILLELVNVDDSSNSAPAFLSVDITAPIQP